MNPRIFLMMPLMVAIGGVLWLLYAMRPSGTNKFKIGDRVYRKETWCLVSEKRPKPDVWVIDDIYKNLGYKIHKEGTCITVMGPVFDKDLESAEGAPRNEIDILINDTLRSSCQTTNGGES